MTTPPGGDPYGHPVPGSGPVSAPEQAPYAVQPPQPYPPQPPSSQPQPYGGPLTPTATRPPLDGVSVASLVTAVLGLTPVGLVTGVIGIVRTAGGRRRGLGLAVAGILVSVLVAAFQVFFVGAIWPDIRAGYEDALEDSRAATSEVEDAGDVAGADEALEPADEVGELVPFEELAVGDCFDEPAEEEFTDILVLPCDVPHDGEVVAEVTLDDGEWLGDDEVFDLAYDACLSAAADAFEEAGVEGRDLDFWTFTPTREGWVLYGDREVDCLAYALDGQLTAPVLPRP